MGVQRAKPFAGVRGVPEKLLLPFLPPKAASQKGRKEDIYPAQEKSVGDKEGRERCRVGWGRLLIGMKLRKSPSVSVGAREAGWAFMVARGWWGCCLFIKEPASAGIQRRATMKAPPSQLHRPRPYGSLGLLPASMASPSLNLMRIGDACVALDWAYTPKVLILITYELIATDVHLKTQSQRSPTTKNSKYSTSQ